ncbi:MAG TPA: hypothetical protein VFH88_00315 [Candidatus Krumholzibacteria bacterium]|nr:hypothetical protein [Candidatus Krumholzibacteria bacterium]
MRLDVDLTAEDIQPKWNVRDVAARLLGYAGITVDSTSGARAFVKVHTRPLAAVYVPGVIDTSRGLIAKKQFTGAEATGTIRLQDGDAWIDTDFEEFKPFETSIPAAIRSGDGPWISVQSTYEAPVPYLIEPPLASALVKGILEPLSKIRGPESLTNALQDTEWDVLFAVEKLISPPIRFSSRHDPKNVPLLLDTLERLENDHTPASERIRENCFALLRGIADPLGMSLRREDGIPDDVAAWKAWWLSQQDSHGAPTRQRQ